MKFTNNFDPAIIRNLHLEFHRRLAFPFACFVFTLIGVPLGLQNRRSGKSSGFSLCLAVLLVYYIALSIGKALGQKALVPPAFAMWLPNILFITLGVYIFKKTASEQRMVIFDLPTMLTAWARNKFVAWRGHR